MDLKFEGTSMITGASGFIGRRLREALSERGADVVALRRANSPVPSTGRSAVVAYDDIPGLTALMKEERPEYVFHVAGATKGRLYSDFERANVMPTVNLLQALADAGHTPKRFILVSSLASYGPSRPDQPHAEDHDPAPIEYYGRSKRAAEDALAESKGIPWTIVRPSGVYGPGDVDYFQLFKSASQGLNVFFGNRDRLFSAIYVDDCIRAILSAAQSEKAVGKGYFLCDGEPITWGGFQSLVVENAGRKVMTLNLPEFFVAMAAAGGELLSAIDKKPRLFNRQKAIMGKQRAWTCEHGAARRDLGYTPEVNTQEGVKRTSAWYKENGWM